MSFIPRFKPNVIGGVGGRAKRANIIGGTGRSWAKSRAFLVKRKLRNLIKAFRSNKGY